MQYKSFQWTDWNGGQGEVKSSQVEYGGDWEVKK